jgi:hypothetical protein
LKPKHPWRESDDDEKEDPDADKKEKDEEEDDKKEEPADEEDDVKPVTTTPPKKEEPKPVKEPVKPKPTPTKPPAPEPKKGDFNPEFGLYVERPFYIVSSLGKGRYLDVVNSRLVIKTQNEFDSQKWWFDQKTKTIQNVMYKGKSFDIQHGGRTGNMQLWTTNGQWFQVFKYETHYFMNVKDSRVLEVSDSQDSEGQTCGIK